MEGLSLAEMRELLGKYSKSPSRALGQNFLIDANISSKIARIASDSGCDSAIEIGPGLGSLTVFLADMFERLVLVEQDRFLEFPLMEILAKRSINNVDLTIADAMQVDLGELLSPNHRWVLAANLPYNISAHLIVKVLEQLPAVEALVVMVQAEVGDRLTAQVGSKSYSQLSVKVSYFAQAKVVMKVPPQVFLPKPKVDSIVCVITRRPTPELDVLSYTRLFALVKLAFTHRRKMLRRSLAPYGGESLCLSASILPTRRAEELDLEDWLALTSASLEMNGGGCDTDVV